jgi:site-specific DNA-cytosine methylase
MTKKYNAISYCIFTGSNFLACKSTGRFNQDTILENMEGCLEGNSMHLQHNHPDLHILPPSQYEEAGSLIDGIKNKQYDYMYANPPCSGLSSINRSSRTDSGTNDYMYEFFRLVGEVKPNVFFMENAPHLTGKKGWPILQRMVEKLEDEYSFTICRDMGKFHGVCMHRDRSLILGFRKAHFGENATFALEEPDMKKFDQSVLDLVKSEKNSPVAGYAGRTDNAVNNAICRLITENQDVVFEAQREIGKIAGAMTLIAKTDVRCTESKLEKVDWDEIINRTEMDDKLKSRFIKEKNRIIEKFRTGGNVWDKTPILIDEERTIVPSLTAVTSLYNMREQREFSVEEYGKVMGYDEDFEFLEGATVGHIAQGVPFNFAKFVHKNVVDILDGKRTPIEGNILIQKNRSGKYDLQSITKERMNEMVSINEKWQEG